MKFDAVGFASLAVESALLTCYLSAQMNYLAATTVSFAVSIVVNYLLSMRYVFTHRDGLSASASSPSSLCSPLSAWG